MNPTQPDRESHDPVESLDDQARRRLARFDQRYTVGRRRLMDLLARAGRPLTLPEILRADPALPQSSVYRNLEVLERAALVRRISAGPDHSHYELSEPLLGHHHHLVCVDCGAIEDVELDERVEKVVDSALTSAAATAGFTPSHHSIDLHGRCATCVAST